MGLRLGRGIVADLIDNEIGIAECRLLRYP